jgi:hypothetical protein
VKIYIDSEFKCHTTNGNGTFREVETDFFNGKCVTFIEGYRFVPVGESWTRGDGVVFHGKMVAPWKPYAELQKIQTEFDLQELREMFDLLLSGVTE